MWSVKVVLYREWGLPDGRWCHASLFPSPDDPKLWSATMTLHRSPSGPGDAMDTLISHVCVAEDVDMDEAKRRCMTTATEWGTA